MYGALPPVSSVFTALCLGTGRALPFSLLLVLQYDFILQLQNVRTDGSDLEKGSQRKSAWKRRKEEMKVQVRFRRGDLGICFQICLFLLHTLGRGGRHVVWDIHHAGIV